MTAIYLPIIRGPYTKSDPSPYTSELSLAGMTRESLVRDIHSGQIENVDRILEINEADGTCRDATGDVAKAVGQSFMMDGSEPWADLASWLDWHSAPYVDEYADERSDRAEHGTHFHSLQF